MGEPILHFRGEYFFLSNFFPIVHKFHLRTEDSPFLAQDDPNLCDRGILVASSEHSFQALKAVDNESFLYVLAAPDARTAKHRGREIKCRPDWEEGADVRCMFQAIGEKFRAGDAIRQSFLETKNALLAEGNTWGDVKWGLVQRNGKWHGQNRFGKLLMLLRWQLATEKNTHSQVQETLSKIALGEL